MHYILILTLIKVFGLADAAGMQVTAIEFNTKEACIMAGQQFAADHKKYDDVKWQCSPKDK
jgi:hypothetical protein